MSLFRRRSLGSIFRKTVTQQLQPKPERRQAPAPARSSRNTILDQHFQHQETIEHHYRLRDKHPGALQAAIDACSFQIAMAPEARKAFLSDPTWREDELPFHKGFTQLAIILEKRGAYEEGIRLCQKAAEQGWSDNWDRRIERMEKKMAKAPR